MSFALLFSGQGTQHAAMLPWLADDDVVVRDMSQRLGVEDWRQAMADSTWTERNGNAQILLTGLASAAWAQLASKVARPAAIAGYSVGELAAFGAAGVMDAQAALALAQQRAGAMDECAARVAGGLLAINGLPDSRLSQLLTESGLALAIRNGVESVVLGGPVAALAYAQRIASDEGAQCTRLRVNVASHTPWMREAAQSFAQALGGLPLRSPQVPLFSNAADRIRDAESARAALAAQIACPVRWDECMENIVARQVRCVLEVGPGQALARIWNRQCPSIPARSCDDFRSVAAIVGWLESHSDR